MSTDNNENKPQTGGVKGWLSDVFNHPLVKLAAVFFVVAGIMKGCQMLDLEQSAEHSSAPDVTDVSTAPQYSLPANAPQFQIK